CFWHACPDHGVMPKNNRDWWSDKLAATVARDSKKDAALHELGWHAIHVWEHEDAGAAADAIVELWRKRTGRPEMTGPAGAQAYPGGRGRFREGHQG
ncbi:MAG: hypothetical protein Q8K58_13545, partial [Acidimicrobiales bacterium]|nr:hypothetical protein [Acidimicrobiales bacterium]